MILSNKNEEIYFPENLIYTIGWSIVFIGTILNFLLSSSTGELKIVEDLLMLTTYLSIFLINNHILVPRLLYKRRFSAYIIFALILIVVFITLLFIILEFIHRDVFVREWLIEFVRKIKPNRSSVPQGHMLGNLPGHPGAQRRLPIPRLILEPFAFAVSKGITASLLLGLNTAFKLSERWLKEISLRRNIEKERYKSEMAFLKSQVSPHFLMNTLNNIHTLIDMDANEAKKSIIALSKLLRHQLYDLEQGKTTLKKEIEFFKNYLDLTRLRYTDKVEIKVTSQKEFDDIKIPPMLFIVFMENAFKHGISYKNQSYVHIDLKQDKENLYFKIRNSIPEVPRKNNHEGSGIGLENVKKRLNLIYKNNYTLLINKTSEEFNVELKLPVNEDKMYGN